MIVRREQITPTPPPTKIVIELDKAEARSLRTILGHIGTPAKNQRGPAANLNDDLYLELSARSLDVGMDYQPFVVPPQLREGV